MLDLHEKKVLMSTVEMGRRGGKEPKRVKGAAGGLALFDTFGSGGEHPVSAKFRGLRNRFVRWWVLGAPHEQPIFTPAFEKSVIFSGANRVSAAFQLRFSSDDFRRSPFLLQGQGSIVQIPFFRI